MISEASTNPGPGWRTSRRRVSAPLLATAIFWMLSYGGAAEAQEEPEEYGAGSVEEPLPPEEPASEERAVKVAVFVFPEFEVDTNVATELTAGLRRGIRADQRLEYVDPSSALETEDTSDTPSSRGAQLVETAYQRAGAGRWRQIVRLIDDARELFESDLPHARRRDLVDASLLWGAAQCKLRRRRVCESAFREVVTFRENAEYDTSVLPEDVAQVFEEIRDETLTGDRGSIGIESEPPGAEVFVDGRFVGAAPTSAEGLLAGDHYVTLKLPGYAREVRRVTVSTDFEESVNIELYQLENAPLLRDALSAAREEMGDPQVGPGMRDLWSLLLVDQVVLADLRRIGETDDFNIVLYLYDLRTNHGLRRIERRMTWSEVDLAEAEQLAVELYRDVDLSGRIQPREEPLPQMPDEPVPFYRTWWFWSIAGAVIVGTTIGVASALAPEGQPEGTGRIRLSF